MAPVRKHVGRDKFSTLFGALKTQQYLDPGFRPSPAITYVPYETRGSLLRFNQPSDLVMEHIRRPDRNWRF